ncbi:MAG: hypothetical protein KDA92_11930, partial [Planctomycetales bacterium]|nr:hypothetical protein [Planctomycetales bacterium]
EEIKQQFPAEPRSIHYYEADAALRSRFNSLRSQLAPDLGQIQLLEDPQDARLGIVATDSQHQQVQALLDELKRELPQVQEQLKVFAVTPTQRSRFAALQPSLAAKLGTIRVLDESRPNELVVWGNAEQLELIASLLPTLKAAEPQQERSLVAYTLRDGDPAAVQQVLQELYPDLKIIIDAASGRVMVWTTAEQHQVIDQAIKQLDAPKAAGKNRMSYYRLVEIDARDVSRMLSQLVPQMTITVDRDTNSIIAWGSDKDHELIRKSIDEFKQQQAAGANRVVSYPTGAIEPRRLRFLLNDLIPRARIISDEDTRQILVWASPEEHLAVEQTLKEAARQSDNSDAMLEVYRLSRIPAANAVTLLTQIVPTAKATSSSDGTRLLVWATESQHGTIKQAIEQIEAGESTDTPASARAYRADASVIRQLEQLMTSVAPGARVLPDAQAGVLLLWATERDHAAVAKLLESLGTATTAPTTTLVTYTLKRAKPTQARELIQSVAPDAKLLTADEPQQLLIQASETDHALIRSTLEQLEQAVSAPSVQAVRVYPLGKSAPATILPLLPPDLLQSVTVIPDAVRNALIMRASDARHAELSAAITAILRDLPEERKRVSQVYRLQYATPSATQAALAGLIPTATLTIDNETRSLIAAAYPEDHEQLQTAIQQLDQPQTSQRQTRVYKLGSRDFFGLRSALQELVPNATVASDRSSRMMLVTASETDLQRIDEVMDQLTQSGEGGRETKIYRLSRADVRAAADALEALLPAAAIRSDRDNRVVIVTGDAEDQQRAKAVVEQLESALPDDLVTEAFALKSADPRAVRDALRTLLTDATVDADPDNRTVVVTCPTPDMERARAVVAQLDQANAAGKQTQVYRLQYGDVSAAGNALEDLLPRGSVSTDVRNRAIIVTASEADQQRVQAAISQLDSARPDPNVTHVYTMQRGDVAAAQRALTALLPDAVFANDPVQRTLIATATPEQHERIAVTVSDMDRRSAQEATLQAYSVTQANLQTVLSSLKTMYDRNPEVALTADETSHSILVKAAPAEQQTIAQVVAQMENSATQGDRRTLAVYDMPSAKSDTLLPTLQTLFEKQTPPVDLSINTESQQLIAVATPQQHAILAGSIERMKKEPTVLEVFPLQNSDPFSIEMAIEQLYQDEANKPLANGDSDTQQLFVRGTQTQIEEVRKLLEKMGELPAVDAQLQRGIRVVPMRGDLQDAVRQLQQIWPKLRANPIHVVPSSSESIQQIVTPPATPKPAASDDSSINSNTEDHTDAPASQSPDAPQQDDVGGVRSLDSVQLALHSEPMPIGQEGRIAQGSEASEPPLVVMPKGNTITLLSDDDAALNQAEALMRALARQNVIDGGAGNFAVYSLRNAGARNLAKLLTELFEQMPIATRGSLGRVSMVADDRLNAVIVHGRPADRNVIAELLQVLDSANVPDSLANARPRLVQVEYMKANDVLTILEGVYAVQLKAGGTRPELEIPRGVSEDVALLLRQINASSSGPLLTLEVDEITNSIIVLAPTQLSSEVGTLIQTLDTNAQENDARGVGIVTLRGTNVQQLQPAIDQLLRAGRRRR